MIHFNYPSRWYSSIRDELEHILNDVYSNDCVFEGPVCKQVEDLLKLRFSRKHAFLVSNGTSAIQLMLMVNDVSPSDKIAVINYSCPATVMPIKVSGAVPIFCDIDMHGQQSFENLKNTKIKCILATGLYGDCYDHDAIKNLGVPILNDSAQSYGAKYKGQECVSLGDVSILSFALNKPCPTFGTYGAILCDDDNMANRILAMRRTGYRAGQPITEVGINAQPQEDKAAQVLVSLKHMDSWYNRRKKISEYYDSRLQGIDKRSSPDYSETNYHKYCIFVQNKLKFASTMAKSGVECHLHYTYNFAKTDVLQSSVWIDGNFSNTEFFVEHAINLPLNPWLSDAEVEMVADKVRGNYFTQ